MSASDPRELLDDIERTLANDDDRTLDEFRDRHPYQACPVDALRRVLDHMDLAVELMPNVPAVPVSVLRSVITRALEGR